MKQAIAYTFDGVTSCQWLSDDEARIIQQNQQGIPAGEAREYFLGGELLFSGSSRGPSGGPFQSFRFKDFEPDPNAAMIARDGDAQSKKLHFVVDEALMLDCRPFTFWIFDLNQA